MKWSEKLAIAITAIQVFTASNNAEFAVAAATYLVLLLALSGH